VFAALLAGCTPGPPAAAPARPSAAGNAPPAAATATPAKAGELVDRGVRAAQEGRYAAAVADLEKAVRADPRDRKALGSLAQALQGQAVAMARPHNSPLFLRSAEVARALIAAYPKLTEAERQTAAVAFYNEACTLALGGETARAVDALARSLDNGFDQPGTTEADPELDPLRKLPAFVSLQKRCERRHAETVLARFKTFPFDFRLRSLDDKPVSLDDFRGKVTVLSFWGTWSTFCRKQLPQLAALSRRDKGRGVSVVGLNYESETGDAARKLVEAFVKAKGVPYPCVIGDEATRQQIPAFAGYPTTLFLDRRGKVRAHVTGYEPPGALGAIVDALLDEGKTETAAK